MAAAALYRSHHFGQAGAHVERLAEQGLVAIIFGNSPKAMAPWGGRQPLLGTNPLAFACPKRDGVPLVVDMAMSVAAGGKIVVAQKNGEPIPSDWAFDRHGKPTTDPDKALAGSLAPTGGAKGASLALMIEILSAALTGSQFGFEASSFLDAEGSAPSVGQTLLALDPDVFSGGLFLDRVDVLVSAILQEDNVRLPGTSRLAHRKNVEAHGLQIDVKLHEELLALANQPKEVA